MKTVGRLAHENLKEKVRGLESRVAQMEREIGYLQGMVYPTMKTEAVQLEPVQLCEVIEA